MTLPPAIGELLSELGTIKCDSSVPQEVLMTQTRESDQRMPYLEQMGLEGNVWYCCGMVMTLRECMPIFSAPH